MGKTQILDKLSRKLEIPPSSESDAVYILSRVRKILEIDKKRNDKGVLNFYCNLALHSRIDNVPKQVLGSLTRIKDGVDYSNSIIGFEDFHKEFKKFLNENKLPESIYTEIHGVKKFNELLLNIYSDTPIILNNKFQVILNEDNVIHISPYIPT
jgi:hypothetical protein